MVVYILILILVFYSNMRLHKSIFYPTVAQSGIWLAYMVCFYFFQEDFFPLHERTFVILILSVISFSIGGLLKLDVAFSYRRDSMSWRRISFRSSALAIAFILIAYGFLNVNSIDPIRFDLWYFVDLRSTLTDEGGEKYHVVGTLIILLIACIVTYHATNKLFTRQLITLTLGVVVLSVLVGSKGTIYMLAIAIVYCNFYFGHIKPWHLLCGISCLVGIMLLITCTRKSGDVDLQYLLYVGQTYFLGGLVALDYDLMYLSHHVCSGHTLRIVMLWLNKLGANYKLATGTGFVMVPHYTNVFTYLYAYVHDWGVLGAVYIPLLLGFVQSRIHEKALRGNPRWIAFSSLFMYALFMQFFAEQYFLWLSNWAYIGFTIYITTIIHPTCVNSNQSLLPVGMDEHAITKLR